MDSMTGMPLGMLIVEPGLWVGFVVAALFVVGAVRLRRAAQPV